MDSRELHQFVAVAEELHFGRAAERLGIAQPPLSRTVRQLETRLGTTLLLRTSRSVSLTPAGEVLLREGRRVLAALEGAERRTREAGRARLVLATKPMSDGGLLGTILERYAADPAAAEVEIRLCGAGEQLRLLRGGEADLALLRLPHDDPEDLDHRELLVEPEAAIVPRTHRFASRPSLTLADLRAQPLPLWPEVTAEERDAARDPGHLSQLIALGRLLALAPASTARHLRTDLTVVPVTDAPVSTLVVAWPPGAGSPALDAFVAAAVEVAALR
jgi:DNA-binding transcriptional LysR family regulator